jgi:hypothetical protein
MRPFNKRNFLGMGLNYPPEKGFMVKAKRKPTGMIFVPSKG